MDEDRVARIVDDQLRFLRGEGRQPDLTGVSESDRADIVKLLQLIDALADSRPSSPPLEEDPVAIRLGLVRGKPGSPPTEPTEPSDPVAVSTQDLAYRFRGAVEVDPVATSGAVGQWSPAVLCRALAENVLVVLYDPARDTPTAADARTLLLGDPYLTAVAFTTPDATSAAVVVPGDAVDRLVPAEGWRRPADLTWEPLGIALGRYFDRSIPHWDAVTSLPRGDLLDDLGDAGDIVAATLDSVAKTKPQLSHKRHARDFVAALDPGTILAWADEVRSGRSSGADIVSAVAAMCQEPRP